MLRRPALLLLVALATAAALAVRADAEDAATPRASLATFSGLWVGHTRALVVTLSGRARERIDDGCCHRVIRLSFTLSRPRGTAEDAKADLRVTGVTLYNVALYWRNRPRPHVGQRGRLHLVNDVVHDSITAATFCGPRARAGACGA